MRVFAIAFVIALGLGYPVLNRYDPRQTGNCDANTYYALVEGRGDTVAGFQKSRMLTPALARPIYLLVRGHVGSWNPASLALLCVNALFVALSAAMLVILGQHLGVPTAIATMAAFIYLGAFPVANGHLAGLVDASEAAIMVTLALALLRERYALAILLVAVGTTSKETVAPLSAAFAAGWILFDPRGGLRRAASVALVVAVVGVLVASTARSLVEHRTVLPWATVSEMTRPLTVVQSLRGLLAPQWIYAFAALFPVGVWGLRGLPRQWIAAVSLSSAAAMALGVFADAGGNASRPVFNIAGPLLALGTARALCGRSLHQVGSDAEGFE